MASIYTHQSNNIIKTWLLISLFLVLFIGVGYVLSYVFGSPIIFFIAILFSFVVSFGSYWWSDSLVLKMTHAKPLIKEEYPDIYNIVENLSITAGLPMPKLYILNEKAPNAFATGRSPEKSVVAVTVGLIEILDKTELEGVLAHELSHIGNRDMLVSTVIVVLAGTIVYVTDFLFHGLLFSSFGDDDGINPLQILIGIVALLVAVFFATIIKMAISRKREYLADASGALLTRYPEGLASALEKISKDSHKLSVANDATAHLYFENPFKGDAKKKKMSFMTKLFVTHPPVEDRVRALRGL